MGYIKAEEILPEEIITLIQEYVDGKNIYIPKKLGQRNRWGKSTGIKKDLEERNFNIYKLFQSGISTKEIAQKYYLSQKSIQRIIRDMK